MVPFTTFPFKARLPLFLVFWSTKNFSCSIISFPFWLFHFGAWYDKVCNAYLMLMCVGRLQHGIERASERNCQSHFCTLIDNLVFVVKSIGYKIENFNSSHGLLCAEGGDWKLPPYIKINVEIFMTSWKSETFQLKGMETKALSAQLWSSSSNIVRISLLFSFMSSLFRSASCTSKCFSFNLCYRRCRRHHHHQKFS